MPLYSPYVFFNRHFCVKFDRHLQGSTVKKNIVPIKSGVKAPDAGYMLFGLLVLPKQDFHLQAPAVFSGHALSNLGYKKNINY
jgi:hypothetical protein